MLNHILAALNDYAFAFSQDEGTYTYISSNIAGLAGYGPEEYKENTCLWSSLIDSRDIKKVEDLYDKPLEYDKSTSITYRITTAEGKTKWINDKRCLYIEEDGGNILLSIVKDLEREDEERYNKEEAISGYGILFDNNPNPMWIYEVSSLRFLKVNTAAIKTYGYSEAEFLTMTIQDIRPETDQSALNDFLLDRGIIESKSIGYSNSGIWRHLSKDSELIHAEMYGDAIQYKHYDCRLRLPPISPNGFITRRKPKSVSNSSTRLLIRKPIF